MENNLLSFVLLTTLLSGYSKSVEIEIKDYKYDANSRKVLINSEHFSKPPQKDQTEGIVLSQTKKGVIYYYSIFIKKIVNGININQFAHLMNEYEQPSNIVNDAGKLFISNESSYLKNDDNKMKFRPGEVVRELSREMKSYLLIRFDKVQRSIGLFENPQVILPYSQENIFVDNKTHIYRLVEVGSQSYDNILKHYNFLKSYVVNDGLRMDMVRKSSISNVKFQLVKDVIEEFVKKRDENKVDTKIIIISVVVSVVVIGIAVAVTVVVVRKRKDHSNSNAHLAVAQNTHYATYGAASSLKVDMQPIDD